MHFNFTQAEDLILFHHLVKDNRHNQFVVDMSDYFICVALFIPSVYVLIRTLYLKDKSFLLLLTMILIIGELAGISTAYCIEELFKTAMDLKTLLGTNPDKLNRLVNGTTYSVAIFFMCFSVAHWLFAM